MFSNLIESSSHRSEFKRRGSFFLLTTATYALLFVLAGVVSIYAYDARLREPSTELTMLTFVPPDPVKPPSDQPRPVPNNQTSSNNSNVQMPTRPELIDSPNNPTNPPDEVGVTAPLIPPAPPGTKIGPEVTDPPGSAGVSRGSTQGVPNGPGSTRLEEVGTPPLAAPTPKAAAVLRKKIINSEAISLPKPPYPILAKQMKIQGSVSIQVLIDETGKVISAKALSGNPFLTPDAQKAAYQARFSPTFLGDQPVKVSGVITYNFRLEQ